MLRRKLLTILFVCILLPVLVILFESATTVMSQKKMTTGIAGRYVENLADYAADRWKEGNPERIAAFLSLLADHGYDTLVSYNDNDKAGWNKLFRRNPNARGKFIPGMVAYITKRGELISFSQNAAILANIFSGTMSDTAGVAADGSNIAGSFRLGDKRVTYVAHISSTDNPKVYAVAAVTMMSWMGRNDFNMMKLAFAGTMGMLICLVGLLILRGSVILPLQSLSAEVNTLKWGSETPKHEDGPPAFGRLKVEEISSLKKAVTDLAHRMIDKDSLEKRYLGDIIKAQEDERGRIAQDIHDGPIQVVSALVQRIQMLNLTSLGMPREAASQLETAEEVAQDLVEDLRDICDSLVPPWVSLGIVSCLEEAASRFERQHSITVNTNVDANLDVPQETTLALFRIFQEAVSNAVRHGGATEVNVDANPHEGGGVEFRISDNGVGFKPDAETIGLLLQEGRRGLTGMKRRVELLGGEFNLWSEPGSGTIITVVI
ncbi:MAG: sensor histidine kinase [Synergistaceae bacterium]|nr:sensor histidine kinase [Synergistaceae bacterium]